ncbi:MAG: efflux RND transporter permease subunit [Candidatus Thiodiazotropha sp.]|jgi:multidrug efflux pump subunit AcrB
MNLYRFFIERPLLVNLSMLACVLGGIVAMTVMRFETFPSVDLGIAAVTTLRPGSGAEDVELSITVPIEEELLKVDGIEKVISNSMEGISVITVRMDPDQNDHSRILADIRKAVDRAYSNLPADLPQKPQVEEMSSTKIPVMEIHVTGSVSEETLRRVVRQLEDGLRAVEGVGGVEKVGYRKREVRILLNPDRLQQLGISYGQIIQAIAKRNLRDAGGSLDSFLAEKKVLTVGQFEAPKDVEEVIIHSAGIGNYVRLRDVAEIVLDYDDWQVQTRTDGKMSIVLLPRKKVMADGMKTSEAVSSYVKEFQRSAPPGVKLVMVNDISRFTYDMLDTLSGNAFLGLILVMAVLLMFFGLRMAFWVTMGLPVALCITLILMPFMGLTVNIMTITGLILMLGMLVDDAIVTGESIARSQEQGLSPRDASVKGATRIAGPVMMSAMTTVLAFAPASFLGGLEGKFLWMLPAMALLTLAASLIESQFMLPAHLAHGSKRALRSRHWFDRIQGVYDRIIQGLIRRRYLTIAGFIAAFVLIILWGSLSIRFNLYPEVDVDTFFLKVELPEGASFEYTAHKVRELEEMARQVIPHHDLQNITIQVGHHDTDIYGAREGRNPAWALVSVFMQPQGERTTSSNDAIAELRKRVEELKGYKNIQIRPLEDTPVMGKPVELEIIGNSETRFDLSEILVNYLKKQEGVTEVWTSYKPGKDVVKLNLDYTVLANRGLTVADVTQAVRIAFDGVIINELQTVEEKIEYRLQFHPQEKGKMETLRRLVLINQNGHPVLLRSLADFEIQPGTAAIKHYFGERTLTLFADIDRKKVSVGEINANLAAFIEQERLKQRFDRLRILFAGELEQQAEAVGNAGIAFMVCMLGIFFLLSLLFNSLSQPFLVISVIPFGFMGVIVAFALQGIEMSMMAFIGILGLAGVLVNDSLVMVHHLNQKKREKGTAALLCDDEIAQGAQQRLRPIVITSVTTVAGLIPGAYGLAGYNPFMTPIFMAIAWGVFFGTFVTLVLLPCLYALEQDLRRFLKGEIRPFMPT